MAPQSGSVMRPLPGPTRVFFNTLLVLNLCAMIVLQLLLYNVLRPNKDNFLIALGIIVFQLWCYLSGLFFMVIPGNPWDHFPTLFGITVLAPFYLASYTSRETQVTLISIVSVIFVIFLVVVVTSNIIWERLAVIIISHLMTVALFGLFRDTIPEHKQVTLNQGTTPNWMYAIQSPYHSIMNFNVTLTTKWERYVKDILQKRNQEHFL